MRIGIIADSLGSSFTGIGNYAYNLLKNLPEIEEDNEFVVICSNINIPVPLKCNSLVVSTPRFICRKIIRKLVILPYKLNDLNFDIVHDTYHFGPSLFSSTYRKVVTIFDLSPHLFPETHRLSTVMAHKFLLPLILKKADCIITISNSTKNDLKHLKVDAGKIKVIHLAADEKFQPLDKEKIQTFKTKYNLNFRFLLYIGTLEPRKNIPTLIQAFSNLKKKHVLPHKLVIAGKKGWKYKSIFELIEKLNLQDDVIFTGYVPDEDLPALYNAADLFVFPSLYEGFGLPPLEAMACGCPVITSNTSSLPEVVGDAGIMIDPYDVDGLAEAIYNVLTNMELKEDMVKKGLERAKMFSWEKTAKETLKVYEEVYNS